MQEISILKVHVIDIQYYKIIKRQKLAKNKFIINKCKNIETILLTYNSVLCIILYNIYEVK